MERLKGRPSEEPADGELVTRADGTQAIRVRKRKRRSEQPKREEAKRLQRSRAVQVGAVLVLLIALALGIGGMFLYTNTAPFRKKLSDGISRSLGANVEFKMFRVTPLAANADAVTLNWANGGFFKEVRLRGVTSKISPGTLFGRSISGESMMAREGEITLQTPLESRPEAGGGEDGTPVEFERAVVNKLNVSFGDPTAPAFKIVGTEGSLNTVPNKARKTVNLHRGSLAFQGWPLLRIDRGLLEVQPTEIDLVGLRINDSLTPRGDLDLSGSINIHAPGTRSTLNVKLDSFNLVDLLGPDVGKLLNMRLDTREVTSSNYLAFTAADPGSAELSIAFTNALSSGIIREDKSDKSKSLSSSNTLAGLNFLAFLAEAVGEPYYHRPEFDEATGIIRRKGNQIDFTDLHLERKTHICVKGNLSIAPDKALSGTLRVGLPESVLHLSSNTRLEGMFSPASNNFRWLTVKLGGTLDQVSDDFSKNYAATATAVPEQPVVPETPGAPETDPAKPVDPGKVFGELTTPP